MLDKLKRALGAKGSVKSSPEVLRVDQEGLFEWWNAEFTPEEQNYILTKYQPLVMGTGPNSNSTNLNHIIRPDGTLGPIGSLAALSTWFMTGDDIPLARRILAKSVERNESEVGSPVDRHYIYYHMIRVYHRDRNRDENAMSLAVEACEKQIALAPQLIRERPREWGETLPEHPGYRQLAIILEQNKDYEGAIQLSEEALRQGWNGGWEKRIARCRQRSGR